MKNYLPATVFLYSLLGLIGFTLTNTTFAIEEAQAKANNYPAENWAPVPFDTTPYQYPGEKLKENWAALQRGFGFPFPSAEELRKFYAAHPELRQEIAHYENNMEKFAELHQEAWRLVFSGDFGKAKKLGMQLGPTGQLPAMMAQITYATRLGRSPEEKFQLLKEATDISNGALRKVPNEPLVRIGAAYAAARLVEVMSKPQAILSGHLPAAVNNLKAALKEAPELALSHVGMGAATAGVIAEGGSLVASMTFGLKKEDIDKQFKEAFKLRDDFILSYLEYATALHKVYKDDPERKRQAIFYLNKAISIKPINAIEALEIRAATKLLKEIGSGK